jgi:hypothetical protein
MCCLCVKGEQIHTNHRLKKNIDNPIKNIILLRKVKFTL